MSTAPTSTETISTTIPSWAKELSQRMLGYGAALTFPKQKIDPATGKPMKDSAGNPILETGFQPYANELVAGESPLQKQAISDISRMQVAPQTSQATGFTGLAALQAQDLARYRPLSSRREYYQSPFEPGPPGSAPPLQQYMSPYMQGVVEQQKQQAVRDYSRQIPGLQAAGIRAGARGGTREALLQAEGQRGLNEQLQTIQATGLQNAYQQAAQQASQDAQLRAQYGLAGTQLGEQSRQFGAGLGLQGLQQQLAAAGQLGQLGQQQFQQQSGILQQQLGAGAQQQAQKQAELSSDYQRFIDEMTYPYKQLEFMSNLLRGIPTGDKTISTYSAPPSTIGMLTGITGGLGGLFGGLGK
jgi:hypothetical protein